MNFIQIQTTFDNRDEAVAMANALLDAGLVSCGQISEVESVYNWEGKRCDTNEYLLTLKTRKGLYNECEKFIAARHSYKVPQIIALDIATGSADYLKWIEDSTK